MDPVHQRYLLHTSWSALYLFVCFYIVCLSNSLADDLNTNTPLQQERRSVLPDPAMQFLHRVLFWTASPLQGPSTGDRDEISEKVVDWFVASSVVLWLLCLLRSRCLLDALHQLRRSFFVTGTAYLIRSVTVLMTVLPYSFVRCEARKSPQTPIWLDSFYLMLMMRKACGDMFFSGHTIMYTLSFLAVLSYSHSTFLKVITSANFIIAVLVLIGSGFHYSIDVVVAVVVVNLLWWHYHTSLALAPLIKDDPLDVEDTDEAATEERPAMPATARSWWRSLFPKNKVKLRDEETVFQTVVEVHATTASATEESRLIFSQPAPLSEQNGLRPRRSLQELRVDTPVERPRVRIRGLWRLLIELVLYVDGYTPQ